LSCNVNGKAGFSLLDMYQSPIAAVWSISYTVLCFCVFYRTEWSSTVL